MPQRLLDPTDTSFATQPTSVPTTLPKDVREFGFIPDFKLWLPGDLLLFSPVKPNRAQRAIVDARLRLGYAQEHATGAPLDLRPRYNVAPTSMSAQI